MIFGCWKPPGFTVKGPIFDTEFKLRICDSTRQSYELKPVCNELFGIGTKDQKELASAVNGLRTRARRLGWNVSPDNAADYWLIQYAEEILTRSLKLLKTYQNAAPAARKKLRINARRKAKGMVALCQKYAVTDAERTVTLDLFLEPILDEYEVRHIYEEEMKEIFPVVYAIESRGVYLNRRLVKKGRRNAVERLKKYKSQIVKLCREAKTKLNPETFPNSYPQKAAYFLEELDLEPLHYARKTGNPKLDKSFLEFYADNVPMCGAIQGQGVASKAIGTYYDNYLSCMDELGIIHGSLQQLGAKTGRLSCRNPALQTVPKRAKKGTVQQLLLEVRRPFGPRPGHVWYMLDFSQIEARIFADEANEKFMLKSFRKNRDVYQDFADVIAKQTGFDISRQDTKSIFLGKLYGLGLKKLIKSIMDAMQGQKVDEDDARGVIDCFDEAFPRVSEFMQETIEYAKTNLCVYNRYGQRVDILPPRFDPATGRTIDDSYKGVNYIIQSSAARLMKRAMVKCHQYLQRLGFGWIVMTIHDELIFEFPLGIPRRKIIHDLSDIMSDNDGMFKRVTTPVEVSKTMGSWLEPVECDWANAV
jgi:DNA polymerase I-like protein with 3'-5' exonuclease and polymerase domains